jgi:glycerol-3-phosphate dehydrogenase
MRAPLERAAMVARLGAESFDVAVIGGGVNGAAIARDAAMRGLRVTLIDKADFAGATSSRSSKLIHGGLRYLPQGHLRLVYQALRERERLRRLTAPHLVRPIHFLMPFFRGRRPGRHAIALGLALYDLMAWTPRAERHRRLTAAQVKLLEPGLRADGLVGGAGYYDGAGDDARITIENVIDAAGHGAVILNYAALEDFTPAGPLRVLMVRDLARDAVVNVTARTIVNAAGPWVDDIRRIDDPACAPIVRLTKGVHLIVAAERLPVRNPLVLTDHDGRIVFLMPRDGHVLLGTTDTDFAGDRDQVAVDTADVAYLLGVINEALPGAALGAGDVEYGFAGLRALPGVGGDARPSSVSREELVVTSPSGLLTVAGGKLTTHRAIAEEVVDRLVKDFALPARRCATRTVPLPGARPLREDDPCANNLPVATRAILEARYGTRAVLIARIAAERKELAEPLATGAPAIGAEVVFTARHELARTVEDFLVRRTAMVWRAPRAAREAAPMVARILAHELGWDSARETVEVERFKQRSAPPFRG